MAIRKAYEAHTGDAASVAASPSLNLFTIRLPGLPPISAQMLSTFARWDGRGVLPYVIAPHYKSDPFVTAEVDRSIEYFIAHHMPFIALRDNRPLGGRSHRRCQA